MSDLTVFGQPAVTPEVTQSELDAVAATGRVPGLYEWPIGRFVSMPFSETGLQAGAMTLNQVVYTPLFVGETMTLDRMLVNIQAGGTAGAVCRLGVYSSANMLPDSLLVQTAATDSTGTGNIGGATGITINLTVNAGVYWLAVVSQVAACTLYHRNLVNSPYITYASASGSSRTAHYEDGVTGALNPTATLTGVVQLNPCYWLRRSA